MNRTRFLTFLVFTLLMLIPLAVGQDQASVIEPLDAATVNPGCAHQFSAACLCRS